MCYNNKKKVFLVLIEQDGHIFTVSELSISDAKEWDNKYRQKEGFSLIDVYVYCKVFNRFCSSIGYIVKTSDGEFAGYFAVAYDYRCFTKNKKITTYLWYIERRREINFKLLKLFFRAISKINPSKEYPLWLHADPSGGSDLLKAYQLEYGFLQCRKIQKKMTLRFFDDGRYLYHPNINEIT